MGSGIFKSAEPTKRAKAMVAAVTHFKDPKVLASVSEELGEPMVKQCHPSLRCGINVITCLQVGLNCDTLHEKWSHRESTHAKTG